MAKTIACYPCNFVRVTLTLAIGKWRNLPGGGHRGSNFWFALKGGCSPYFSVLLSCQRVVCAYDSA